MPIYVGLLCLGGMFSGLLLGEGREKFFLRSEIAGPELGTIGNP